MKDVVKSLNHIIFYGAIVSSITGMLGLEEALWYGLWTGALGACCYLLRLKIRKLLLFLGAHLLLILWGVAGIIAGGGFMVYGILLLAVAVLSFLLRLIPGAEQLDQPGYFHIVVLAILFFTATFLGKSSLSVDSGLWGACLVFLLKVLNDNLMAAEEIIESRSGSTRMDVKRLKRQNARLSLVYVGVLGLAIGVAGLFRAEGLGGKIWEALKAFLRFLFSLLPVSDNQQENVAAPVENQPMEDMFEELGEASEPSAFARLLEAIVQVVGVVLLVAAVLGAVIFVIVKIYRHFYNRREEEAAREVTEPLTRREKLSKQKRQKEFAALPPRSPARRIRKIYKKHMKRLEKERGISLACMSPREQLAFWKEEGVEPEAAEEVRRLYEKARYSQGQVTEKEAERMKILLD